MNIPWADDEDDKRRQAEMYYTGDDGETVDISLVSISPDPKQVLEKTPPRIVLGELTRQFLLVEREERMRARAPPSKKAEFAKSGPSPTKLKAISMLKQSTGFLADPQAYLPSLVDTSAGTSASHLRSERTTPWALWKLYKAW